MSFDNRKYHFYLFFAETTKGKEPWTKSEWTKNIQPIFDKILKQSTYYDQTGLGVLQYVPRPASQYFDDMKFGKLRWNEKSFDKWTLTDEEKERKFQHLDCWTPMRTVCAKIDSAPDIYFSIGYQGDHPIKEKVTFDLFIVVAIAEELNYDGLENILELSKAINSRKTVYKTRSWGGMRENSEDNSWEFINSIQDTTSFGIYKAATLDIHDTEFENLKFEPYWQTIYGS